MTDKDKDFLAQYPGYEEEYLRLRAKGNSENMAGILTLRKPPRYGHIPKKPGGEMITSKEYAAEKKKGFEAEKVRRAKVDAEVDNFGEFLRREGRTDVIKELSNGV